MSKELNKFARFPSRLGVLEPVESPVLDPPLLRATSVPYQIGSLGSRPDTRPEQRIRLVHGHRRPWLQVKWNSEYEGMALIDRVEVLVAVLLSVGAHSRAVAPPFRALRSQRCITAASRM